MNKLKLSLSPHVHSGDSVSKNMRWVIIAMLPAMLWSFYAFGLGSLIVTAVSVASCVFFEWAINKYILKNDKCSICDYSAVVTGILLAFNLPSNLPLYIIIIGALFAIGVVKMTFGGLGCNLFNPALAARVFLLISFLGLAAVLLIIFTTAKLQKNRLTKKEGDRLTGKDRRKIQKKPARTDKAMFLDTAHQDCAKKHPT